MSITPKDRKLRPEQPQEKKSLYPYFWLSALIFLVYFQGLFFGFVYLDDNALILDNFEFISKLSNIFGAFKYDAFFNSYGGSYYRPIFTLSFMLDALTGGASPFMYHLTNLLLHTIASCLAYRLFTEFEYSSSKAFLFSAIFGVHPALSQVALWLSGRGESLLAIFVAGSILFLVGFAKTGKFSFYMLHILFFILSVFTKETALTAPLIYFLYLKFIFRGKIPSPALISLISGWLLSIACCLVIRSLVLKTPVAHTDYDIMHTLAVAFPSTAAYVGKIFFPFNLSVFPVLKDISLKYGIIAVILVILLLYLSKTRNNKSAVFGLVWFAAFLSPSLLYPAHLSETRIYLPFIGFLLCLMEIDFGGIFRLNSIGLKVASVLIISLFSIKTILHSRNFKDRLSFWKQAVESSPSHAFNHNNLGSMYYLDGDFHEAEFYWKKAIEINPGERLVHNNLGLIYMNRGDFKNAEAEYLKELEINPLYDNVYFNMGLLCYRQGDLPGAQALWKKAVELNPRNHGALNNLTAIEKLLK